MHHGEKFNAITHLVGAILAIAGTVTLILLASLQGDPWKIVSVSIYGATLVLLYSFSALYHSLQTKGVSIKYFSKGVD
jgi:hemolysin III